MLPRAALRALKPATASSHLRCASPLIPRTSLQIRTLASKPPRPPPPPPASSKPQSRPPPPPKPHPSTAKSARQTSPGTSFPKDQTWKPQDGIKMGGPAAATASGAGKGATAKSEAKHPSTINDGSMDANFTVEDPTKANVEPAGSSQAGSRHPSTINDGSIDANFKVEDPSKQNVEPDASQAGQARGDARKATHQMQAEAEQTAPPAPEQSTTPDSSQPSQPLPDLRQGIPSTFDMEFGKAKERAAMEDETQRQKEAEGLDITYEETESHSQRDRGERDYDRSAYETSLDRRRAKLANYLYTFILTATIGGGLALSRPFSASDIPSGMSEADAQGWGPEKMWTRIRARCGEQIGHYTEPTFPKLLPEMPEGQRQPYTLVLSLEDLMIHSTWDREHGYRTAKRPGIDYFIRYLSQYYELVLFTSVPIAMAEPVIKKLDPYHFIMWPLGREATKYDGGEYVKDLAYLNRPLSKTLIIDTHAPHVKNQPENAIVIPKWSGDPKDEHVKDLVALIPFLEYIATMGIDDVRTVLASFKGTNIPEEFARREAIARAKFNAELAANPRPRRSLGSLASSFGLGGGGAQPGGMVTADGKSVSEGFREGKMLSDQIREQGQKQYEFIEKQIREHGAQWLKEEEEEQKKMMEMQMRDMKRSTFSWFGGGGGEKKE